MPEIVIFGTTCIILRINSSPLFEAVMNCLPEGTAAMFATTPSKEIINCISFDRGSGNSSSNASKNDLIDSVVVSKKSVILFCKMRNN